MRISHCHVSPKQSWDLLVLTKHWDQLYKMDYKFMLVNSNVINHPCINHPDFGILMDGQSTIVPVNTPPLASASRSCSGWQRWSSPWSVRIFGKLHGCPEWKWHGNDIEMTWKRYGNDMDTYHAYRILYTVLLYCFWRIPYLLFTVYRVCVCVCVSVSFFWRKFARSIFYVCAHAHFVWYQAPANIYNSL